MPGDGSAACQPGAEEVPLKQPQASRSQARAISFADAAEAADSGCHGPAGSDDLDGQDSVLLSWAAGAASGTGLLRQCGHSSQLAEHLTACGDPRTREEWCASFANDICELVDAVCDYGECGPEAARRLANGLARLRLERGAVASGLLVAAVSELPSPPSAAAV